jgi:hypothetical protein
MEINKKVLNQDFEVKIPDNHSLAHLQFVFSQSEKRLEESNNSIDFTNSKTFSILSIVIAAFSAISVYIFSNLDINGEYSLKMSTAITMWIYLLYVLYLIRKNVIHIKYEPKGSLPSKMLTYPPKWANTEELHLKTVIYDEMVSYDIRTKKNFEFNRPRVIIIERVVRLLIFFPFLSVLTYSILLFFSHFL